MREIKNKFCVLDDCATMSFLYKGKELLCVIDLETVEKLKELNISWHGIKGKSTDIYVRGTLPTENGIRKSVLLHRWLLDAPEDKIVDHINRTPLDNRLQNLRLADSVQSAQNKGIYKNNTSGARGVHWSSTRNRWVAQVKANGKNLVSRYFKTKEEAKEAVIKLREIYYTHSEEQLNGNES